MRTVKRQGLKIKILREEGMEDALNNITQHILSATPPQCFLI
jgi:hypothetical protein